MLYLTLLTVFPEPRGVYGPDGPRIVRASDTEVPPITGGTEEPFAAEPAAAH